jgi:hypothetical protein
VKPCIKCLLLSFALLAVNNTPGACGGKKSDANRAGVGRTAMIQSGTWGGKGIVVRVSDAGATVEYDCAHGTIEGLEPGRDGGFEARGTHTAESFGPTRRGAEPPTRPARYTGRVSGDEMTLTVTLTDTLEEVGTFSLGRGRRTRIVKCK